MSSSIVGTISNDSFTTTNIQEYSITSGDNNFNTSQIGEVLSPKILQIGGSPVNKKCSICGVDVYDNNFVSLKNNTKEQCFCISCMIDIFDKLIYLFGDEIKNKKMYEKRPGILPDELFDLSDK